MKKALHNDEWICFQDVMPTTLELSGLDKPHHVDFNSLLPLINNPKTKYFLKIHLRRLPQSATLHPRRQAQTNPLPHRARRPPLQHEHRPPLDARHGRPKIQEKHRRQALRRTGPQGRISGSINKIFIVYDEKLMPAISSTPNKKYKFAASSYSVIE